jgi:hypothetical protein
MPRDNRRTTFRVGVSPMIDVIVSFRDAVFAALVAWTGVGDGEADGVKAAKDKSPPPIHNARPVEKPAEQPAARLY